MTCLPSPGDRLSRPRTTMETPLPWESPPEGQSRAALTRHVLARCRSSTHPYARTRCPMSHSRATGEAEPKPQPSSAATLTSVVAGCFPPQPGLDFKQCSLDHAVRVLRSGASTGLLTLRFTDRLLSPTPFPVSGKSVDPGRIGSTASFLGKGCHIKQNAARPPASRFRRAPPSRIDPRSGGWPRRPARSGRRPAGRCGRSRPG